MSMNPSTTVIYNGHVLNSLFVVADIKRTPSGHSVKKQKVPGRAGNVFTGLETGEASISVTVVSLDDSPRVRREKMAELRAWLEVDEPCPLFIPDDGGAYCNAVMTAIAETTYINGIAWRISFSVPEPYLYMPVDSELPSGATSLYVGGNQLVKPVITISSAVRDASTNMIALMVDGSQPLKVPLTSGTHTVVIDCNDRSVTVDGAASMITTDSDWWELEPGMHSFTKTGGGTVAMEWTERRLM